MSVTPRATPVVQPPLQTSPVSERTPRKHLHAPVVVVAKGGEWELESGALVIGRDASANVVIDDPLVSRFHARIVVGGDGLVTLEDLQSANGVFVNGAKLSRPSMLLGEGDRLLIGTAEVSVFGMRASSMVRLGRQVARMPLVSSAQAAESHARATPPSGSDVRLPPRRQIAVTGRTDAINLVGQFADQLMDSGHPVEAVRVLSEHLQNLMKGASAGLSVPPRILETATRSALRLHNWTERSSWIEYVFELHLASLQVPSESSLDVLEPALAATNSVDTALLGYFVKTLERRPEPLTAEELLRLRRIEHFGGARSSRVPPAG